MSAECKPLELPPPTQGEFYRQAEIAGILGVEPATVGSWAHKGIRGGELRLRTLRFPQGRVSPALLCAFLSAANGVEVVIAER